MSKTIDEKIVEMRFDNSNFETNVKKTLEGLDNLKDKLSAMDYSSNAKGFEQIGASMKNVDTSGLSRGLDTVRTKFSALQVMGVTALANITNSAVNAGKKIASALTDSLINGGRERAQKIKDAKFQIEGLLGTEEYNKQWSRIDESINYAVADTAYGYDSAARAASQFLASNVKVGEEMDTSLRAISGVAAMTNSTYDDISNIFTRIAGQGRVMAIDLNSLASRGLNAAAQLGKAMGKTEEEVRDMVSKGQISFAQFAEAMDEAFGEHAKKGNETFSGALANMKAAMSRIGAKVWDPLIDNQRDVFNQARLLINDLNNNYLDGPINSLNEKLNNIFKNLIKFFELGGVKNIILGIGDILSYISTIIKPVTQAFREIFPAKTVEELVNYTNKFKEFTEKLKLSDETASNIKSTFKGLFSILDIGISLITSFVKGLSKFVSNLTGISGGILGATGALGNWITKTKDTIKESKIFSNVIEGVVNMLEKFTNKVKEFCSHLDIFGGIVNGLKAVFNFISKIGSEIGKALSTAIRTGDLEAGLNTLNTGLFGGMILAATRFIGEFEQLVKRGRWSLGNVSGTLFQIKESIRAFQVDLRADAIMKIAKAIAVLAAGLFILAMINPERLGASLGAVAVMILELMGALKLLTMFTMDAKGIAKIYLLTSVIRSLANTLLILAVALKIMGTLDITQMLTALLGLTLALGEMIGAMWLLPKERDVYGSVRAIRKLSTSLLILSVALKIMSTIPWPDILIGLGAMTTSLIVLTRVMKKMPTYSKDDKIPSMIKMTLSLVILAGALKILSTMSWDDIARALTAIGGTFAMLIAFVKFLPKDLKQLNAKINALNMMALGLGFTALALMGLGSMNWEQIKVALVGMGVSLAECMIFLNTLPKDAMSKTAGMIAFSFSLVVLAGALKLLGSLSLPALGIALLGMAGSFIVMGVAAKLLSPLIPVLLKLAGAMALFGLGIGLFGAGVTLVATGIATLAAALAAGTTAIVAGITAIILGIASIVPQLIEIFGESIEAICKVIMTAAPLIAETILVVISEILKSLADHGPSIVDSLFTFIIGILQSLRDRLPEFLVAAMEVINAFLVGILDGLKNLDPDAILPAVMSIGIITGVMYALAGLVHIVPQAMIGVLALGLLIAELGVVLAAIGGLSKIPGLNELVTAGGNFLQIVGTAIGQFIGGIIGGIALGATATMPAVAENLSAFMQNIMPFINGAKTIDMSVLGGIAALAAAIYLISGANLIASIVEFLTVGSSFSTMGTQLSDFMTNIQGFIQGASNIDAKVLDSISTLAAAILAITAANMLNSMTNFMSIFTGGNSLAEFGNQLSALGTGLNQFVTNLGTFGDDQIKTVNCACDALKSISQAASEIPNSGGLAALFAGDNDIGDYAGKLKTLGSGMNDFASSLNTFGDEQVETVKAAAEAIKVLSQAASEIPNSGGLAALFAGDNDIAMFAAKLPIVGWGLSSFAEKLGSFGDEQITAVKNGAEAIKTLSQVANEIPNSGGLVTLFTGDNDISTFSAKLPIVGWGLSALAEKLGSFGDEQMTAIKNGAETIKTLSQVANEIPNSGGLVTLFTGDNDISTFSAKLPIVGWGLASLAEKLKGYGEEQINATKAAAEVIAILIETSAKVPTTGGIASLFTGDNDMAMFAFKLPIVGTYLSKFVESIDGITEDSITTAKYAAEALAAIASVNVPRTGGLVALFAGDNDISLFAGKLPGVATSLKGFITNLADTDISEKKVTTAKYAAEVLAALASVDVPRTGGLKALFEGDNDISKFAEKFPGLASNLNSFISNIGEFGEDKVATVHAAAESLKAMAQLGGVDLKGYSANLEEFGNKMVTFSGKLKEYLTAMNDISAESVTASIEKVNSLIKMAKSISSEAISNLSTFTDSIANIGKEGIQEFVVAFTDEQPKNDVITAVTNLIQSIIDTMESKKGDIESKANELIGSAISALKTETVSADVVNAGLYFVQGFANGISNNMYLATDAASAVGREALAAAKAAINSNSPSKETFKLGTFFDQGFMLGIEKLRNKIYDSAYSTGNYAKSGLTKAISRISDVINGDIDTQPTIRPILDLSDVESGVGYLSSMLSNGPSVGVKANLDSISYGMNAKVQNGVNGDVVSAIDKLRKDLGNTRGDTYNVNGITYDDGSNITEAVREIVRAAKVERRK